jgi:hypothetical protein
LREGCRGGACSTLPTESKQRRIRPEERQSKNRSTRVNSGKVTGRVKRIECRRCGGFTCEVQRPKDHERDDNAERNQNDDDVGASGHSDANKVERQRYGDGDDDQDLHRDIGQQQVRVNSNDHEVDHGQEQIVKHQSPSGEETC